MGTARQQPFDRVPDLSRPGFVAGWLNKGVIPLGAARDIGPDAYDMTRVGKPVEERVGMTFDGTNYLRRAEADWRIGDSQGTVLAWVKHETAQWGAVFETADEVAAHNYFEILISNTGVISVLWKNGAGNDANTSTAAGLVTLGTWHRVGVTGDGSTWRIYVDGTEVATTPGGVGGNTGAWLDAIANRDNVCIGARVWSAVSAEFDGTIKDVQYHSTLLSADEIAYDYAQGVPDDDLRLHLDGRGVDLTRYGLEFTKHADVIVGHEQSYDGVGDYLDATAAAWRAADEVGSLIAWIRPADIAKGMAIFASSDEGTDDYIFEWALTAAGVQFIYALENTVVVGSATGTAAMLQDVWQQLVLTSDGSNYLFYRNGVLDALAGGGTDSGAWLADVTLRDNVTVGGLEYNSGLVLPWEGQISYVKYLSRILSADEIAEIYAREEVAY